MTARVSVVVPAYRCERTVEDAVRSALNGTVRDIEVFLFGTSLLFHDQF